MFQKANDHEKEQAIWAEKATSIKKNSKYNQNSSAKLKNIAAVVLYSKRNAGKQEISLDPSGLTKTPAMITEVL